MLTRALSPLDADTEAAIGRTIGCAIRVHQVLGPGFLELVYHDAMSIELELEGIAFKREVAVPVSYRGRPLRVHRLDLVVADCLIVELKAVDRLEAVHQSQLVSYLRASGLRAGLLMNFNTPVLKSALRRIVL